MTESARTPPRPYPTTAGNHVESGLFSASPRRVALFSINFLPYSQTFVYDEIRYHERYEVEVFCHRRMCPERFDVEEVNWLVPSEGWMRRAEGLLYKATLWSPSHSRRLRQGKFDLLHAHFGTGSIYALPYKTLLGRPLVVTFHGYDVPVLLTRRRFRPEFWRYWLLSRWMLRSVDRFLAASDELARLLVQLGDPAERVKVWRLGVEIPTEVRRPDDEGSSSARPISLLMVGRFVEKKGIEYGLEALARAIATGLDLRLRIVGDGPLQERYRRLIARLALGDRVHFLGVLRHEEVMQEMLRADILLAPSVVASNGDRESGILVIKEANARRLPAIGTWHGGIPEIIDDGETGFLVPERDTETLTARLVCLASDGELRRRFGRAARAKMKTEYDIRQCVQVLEQHYDEVLA